mgnify:CR=1 FL=1
MGVASHRDGTGGMGGIGGIGGMRGMGGMGGIGGMRGMGGMLYLRSERKLPIVADRRNACSSTWEGCSLL